MSVDYSLPPIREGYSERLTQKIKSKHDERGGLK